MSSEWEWGRYRDMDAHFGPAVGAALAAAAPTGVPYLALAYLRPATGGGRDRGLVRLNVVALRDRYIIHTAEYPADEFDPRRASIALMRDGFGAVTWQECETNTWTALAIPEEREEW
ncbi:hypothetical protein [Streptomyces sp. NBC_01565]|uniref:hypothetical protein n=1 Tax=Streptomyces sp. NBC_01565 TaxID=2975881 RepID=UPI00224D6331|nr:hypothetical protein [Streptomyces sp. NBC_01565]MCX4547226.1 hypothetical protein [Streptomyces sp. NBC_01565]